MSRPVSIGGYRDRKYRAALGYQDSVTRWMPFLIGQDFVTPGVSTYPDVLLRLNRVQTLAKYRAGDSQSGVTPAFATLRSRIYTSLTGTLSVSDTTGIFMLPLIYEALQTTAVVVPFSQMDWPVPVKTFAARRNATKFVAEISEQSVQQNTSVFLLTSPDVPISTSSFYNYPDFVAARYKKVVATHAALRGPPEVEQLQQYVLTSPGFLNTPGIAIFPDYLAAVKVRSDKYQAALRSNDAVQPPDTFYIGSDATNAGDQIYDLPPRGYVRPIELRTWLQSGFENNLSLRENVPDGKLLATELPPKGRVFSTQLRSFIGAPTFRSLLPDVAQSTITTDITMVPIQDASFPAVSYATVTVTLKASDGTPIPGYLVTTFATSLAGSGGSLIGNSGYTDANGVFTYQQAFEADFGVVVLPRTFSIVPTWFVGGGLVFGSNSVTITWHSFPQPLEWAVPKGRVPALENRTWIQTSYNTLVGAFIESPAGEIVDALPPRGLPSRKVAIESVRGVQGRTSTIGYLKPDPANSTVTTDLDWVPASGSSTISFATITITLRTSDGTPVPGFPVSTGAPVSGVVVFAQSPSQRTDENGVATFHVGLNDVTYGGVLPVAAVFSAIDPNTAALLVTQTATVNFFWRWQPLEWIVPKGRVFPVENRTWIQTFSYVIPEPLPFGAVSVELPPRGATRAISVRSQSDQVFVTDYSLTQGWPNQAQSTSALPPKAPRRPIETLTWIQTAIVINVVDTPVVGTVQDLPPRKAPRFLDTTWIQTGFENNLSTTESIPTGKISTDLPPKGYLKPLENKTWIQTGFEVNISTTETIPTGITSDKLPPRGYARASDLRTWIQTGDIETLATSESIPDGKISIDLPPKGYRSYVANRTWLQGLLNPVPEPLPVGSISEELPPRAYARAIEGRTWIQTGFDVNLSTTEAIPAGESSIDLPPKAYKRSLELLTWLQTGDLESLAQSENIPDGKQLATELPTKGRVPAIELRTWIQTGFYPQAVLPVGFSSTELPPRTYARGIELRTWIDTGFNVSLSTTESIPVGESSTELPPKGRVYPNENRTWIQTQLNEGVQEDLPNGQISIELPPKGTVYPVAARTWIQTLLNPVPEPLPVGIISLELPPKGYVRAIELRTWVATGFEGNLSTTERIPDGKINVELPPKGRPPFRQNLHDVVGGTIWLQYQVDLNNVPPQGKSLATELPPKGRVPALSNKTQTVGSPYWILTTPNSNLVGVVSDALPPKAYRRATELLTWIQTGFVPTNTLPDGRSSIELPPKGAPRAIELRTWIQTGFENNLSRTESIPDGKLSTDLPPKGRVYPVENRTWIQTQLNEGVQEDLPNGQSSTELPPKGYSRAIDLRTWINTGFDVNLSTTESIPVGKVLASELPTRGRVPALENRTWIQTLLPEGVAEVVIGQSSTELPPRRAPRSSELRWIQTGFNVNVSGTEDVPAGKSSLELPPKGYKRPIEIRTWLQRGFNVLTFQTVEPSSGTLVLTGSTPPLTITVNPDAGTLSITGSTPPLTITVNPSAGTLVLTGSTPALTVFVEPSQGTLDLTGSTPPLTLTVYPDSGTLVLTGSTPTVIQTNPGDVSIEPAPGVLVIIGSTPTITLTCAILFIGRYDRDVELAGRNDPTVELTGRKGTVTYLTGRYDLSVGLRGRYGPAVHLTGDC